MVVDICNAKVTYSVKQLTAGCVDETSFHFGFIDDNDYNIRYSIISCIVVCRWLSSEHSNKVVILGLIEINEQLSVRNSLNALLSVELYELIFFSRIGVCMSGNWI